MGGFFKGHEHNLDNNTTMMYGDYTFSPVPLVSINKDFEKTGDGQILGTTFRVTLEGSLVPGATGVNGIAAIAEEQDRLMAAFAGSGQGYEFKVACGNAELISCFPRINSVNLDAGPWIDVSDYVIELEYDRDFATDIGAPWNDDHKSGSGMLEPLISSASENWNIEKTENNYFHFTVDQSGLNKPTFVDETPPSFTVTHTINAVGKPFIVSGVIPEGGHAWQQASGYVVPRLGFNHERVTKNGGICFDTEGKIIASNHTRAVSFGELDGNYEVTETWTVYPSSVWSSGINTLGASDVWEVSVESSLESSLSTVSIQGTITGAESGVFCDASNAADSYRVTTSKYENAKKYFDKVTDTPNQQNLFWARAAYLGSGIASRGINTEPISKTIGHNPSQGTINYAFRFDDRPGACIAGAKTTQVSVNDTNAIDVFAELVVLGRAPGPVMQDIGTVTSKKRQVTLEATMPVDSAACNCDEVMGVNSQAPSDEAETILLTFRPDNCGGTNLIIFKNIDTESWNPTTGRYTRQMGWVYTSCG